MELRFDGLYSRVAAIGRSSIRGILLVTVSLLPGLPGSWSSAYERWKLNIIKSCLAGYTETVRNRGRTWPVTMDTYKHGARCWSHWSRERELQVHTWPNGNMNLDKTSGWLSTFQFAPGLIVYCECEWVYLALMQLVISLSSWLPSVIRDQDGIKRNNKHDPFRNNLLRLFFLLSPARSQWDVNIGIMRGDKWEAAMVSDGGDPGPPVISDAIRGQCRCPDLSGQFPGRS